MEKSCKNCILYHNCSTKGKVCEYWVKLLSNEHKKVLESVQKKDKLKELFFSEKELKEVAE